MQPLQLTILYKHSKHCSTHFNYHLWWGQPSHHIVQCSHNYKHPRYHTHLLPTIKILWSWLHKYIVCNNFCTLQLTIHRQDHLLTIPNIFAHSIWEKAPSFGEASYSQWSRSNYITLRNNLCTLQLTTLRPSVWEAPSQLLSPSNHSNLNFVKLLSLIITL